MAEKITGYTLSRIWFDFCFENPEKVKPAHTAVFFFAVEHNNRLGWREKFGFPTEMAMSAVGIKNWRTYNSTLKDLEEWGFFEFIERSRNQYSSNIISIFACVKNTKAKGKALDKAMQKHSAKHSTKQGQSTVVINKPKNLRTNKPKNLAKSFSPEDKKFAEVFFESAGAEFLFTQKKDEQDVPQILETWAEEFRKLREIDGLTDKQIEFLIEWLLTSQTEDAIFWRKQIRTPGKLRKKNKDGEQYWRVLVMKIKAHHAPKKSTPKFETL